MTRSLSLRLAGVLVAMVVIGWLSVRYAPEGTHLGLIWPAGLGVGALLISPTWLRPWTAIAVGVIATATYLTGGVPFGPSVGVGIAIAAGAVVAQQVLTPGSRLRGSFTEDDDLLPYGVASIGGALVTGVIVLAVSAALSYGVAWQLGFSAFFSTFTSNTVLLAVFRDPGRYPGVAGHTERLLTWVVVLATAYVAFVPSQGPSAAFLVIPLLGWAAFRLPMREAIVLLVVVGAIALSAFNLGFGPFPDTGPYAPLARELVAVPVQAFVLACAMVVIPFSTSVGMQRRSASEAIMERARSARLVQSAHGIAIIGTDQAGRINMFNPGAELILGYSPQEVYGRSMRIFFSQSEIARQAGELGTDPTYLSVLPAMLRLPPGTAREWQFTRKDGLERTLSTILSPVDDDLGEFVGYVATADDVTDRLRTQDALEKALETERRAVSRLTEVDQIKDAFVSAVSHELRTPITNIVGYLELLLDGAYGDPSEEQAQALARVDVNSRRLLTLIDDLLTLSSVENIDGVRLQDPVDLRHVVARAEEIVRPGLRHRDLRVAVVVPDEPALVDGDAGQLERLVINLATNAIKFTPDGGRVTLRVVLTDDLATIEVEDTGVGIPEDEQPMLFSRFFRTAQAREGAVQGSGLGLSIAKSIADRHGGRIVAMSTYGEGSLFRVELPRRTR